MFTIMDKTLMLKQIKSHLALKKDTDFADFLGIKPQTLSSWYTRNTFDYELLYAKCLWINPHWLMTGEGDMVKSMGVSEPEAVYEKTGNAVALGNMGILNAPLVSQYAYAGYLSGYSDPVYVDTLPTIPFLIPEGITAKGSYRAFEVRGDSYDDGSSDSVLEGDVVLGRKISPDLYRDSRLHISKWLFVIVHKEEGILLKRIKEHNVEQRYLVLESLNPMYEDRIIQLVDVAEVYNVVQLLRKPKA